MRRGLIAAAALGLAMALAAPAGAGEAERVKTKVTIKDACNGKFGNPGFECRMAARARRQYEARFSGRVKSDEPKCERGRKVKVILVEVWHGRRGLKPGVIGTTRSNENGRWVYKQVKPGFGDYIAKATKKTKGDIICKADKSRRIEHIPEPE
jgi:hypothetical protein